MAMEDFEIEDDDLNYSSGKKNEFSHNQLVMNCMSKCLEAGSKEMMEGYFNQKTDKFGNTSRVYIEDTRKVFIESVKTAIEIIRCDLDETAKNQIKIVMDDLNKKYEELCEIETEDFTKAHPIVKNQRISLGITNMKNTLNKELPYYQEYIHYEIQSYRKLLGVLSLLTARKDFYAEAIYMA